MIADPNGIDFGTKTYRFGHFSGPSYRGAHAGWPAALLGGQLGFLETYVNQGARAFCLHVNRRPHSQPGAHAGWPAALLGGQLWFLEAYVNQGARAFCLHVNRRPHSQPANTRSARLGTFETRVNRSACAVCLRVNRRARALCLHVFQRSQDVPGWWER